MALLRALAMLLLIGGTLLALICIVSGSGCIAAAKIASPGDIKPVIKPAASAGDDSTITQTTMNFTVQDAGLGGAVGLAVLLYGITYMSRRKHVGAVDRLVGSICAENAASVKVRVARNGLGPGVVPPKRRDAVGRTIRAAVERAKRRK